MKHLIIPSSMLVLSLFSGQINAVEVSVEWLEPQSYRDIDAGSSNQKRFEKNLLEELTEQFSNSAQLKMPSNHQLTLKVTDVDLAGRIDFFYNHGHEIRIVRNIDFPSITFSYEIKDENDRLVSSGEERIKDLGFNSHGSFQYRNLRREPFYYEKELINDWFESQF